METSRYCQFSKQEKNLQITLNETKLAQSEGALTPNDLAHPNSSMLDTTDSYYIIKIIFTNSYIWELQKCLEIKYLLVWIYPQNNLLSLLIYFYLRTPSNLSSYLLLQGKTNSKDLWLSVNKKEMRIHYFQIQTT